MGAEGSLQARALVALSLASVRYVTTVGPVVAGLLEHWRTRAQSIRDPELRALALQKLDDERFNAEAGAMLATLAPAAHRKNVVEAIVALELLFDLLDGLTERPLPDPLRDGRRLFAPFTDALVAPAQTDQLSLRGGDDYLLELSGAARRATLSLPALAAVRDLAVLSAERAAQAQIRMHAVPALGIEQLELWAREQVSEGSFGWRELLAGSASSVLRVHALIVAAADDRTTPAGALRISEAYLPICVLVTLLDGLLDQGEDLRHDRTGYLSVYPQRRIPKQTLSAIAQAAARRVSALPDGPHHLAMLTGIVAYYTSAPGALGERVRVVTAPLQRQLAPLILPALVVLHGWRLARRLCEWALGPGAYGQPGD